VLVTQRLKNTITGRRYERKERTSSEQFYEFVNQETNKASHHFLHMSTTNKAPV